MTDSAIGAPKPVAAVPVAAAPPAAQTTVVPAPASPSDGMAEARAFLTTLVAPSPGPRPAAPKKTAKPLVEVELRLSVGPRQKAAPTAAPESNKFSGPLFDFTSDFASYKKHLTSVSPQFNLQQKVAFLTQVGSIMTTAAAHKAADNSVTSEQIYGAVKNWNPAPGDCGPSAKFLADLAGALGLQDAGVHEVNWQVGGAAVAHDVVHFRDPNTGEFWVLNYSQAFNTHQKTMEGMIDVTSQMFGLVQTSADVFSAPGRVHNYMPRLTRYLRDRIDAAADKDGAPIQLKLGNREQALSAKWGGRIVGDLTGRVFALGNQYSTADGPYRMAAAGVASEISEKNPVALAGLNRDVFKLSGVALSEVGFNASLQVGTQVMGAPNLSRDIVRDSPGTTQKESSAFANAKLGVFARFDRLTLKLTYSQYNFTLSESQSTNAYTEAQPGADFALSRSVTLAAQRNLYIGADEPSATLFGVHTRFD